MHDRQTIETSKRAPQLLQGSDVVAVAHTGTGKTLAYLLPALHKILTQSLGRVGWQALVLVPTRELCQQVADEAGQLIAHVHGDLTVTALAAQDGAIALRKAAVSTAGQLVVATPGRIAQALRDGSLTAQLLSTRLHTLVLDEADLLMSYGHEDDIAALAPLVPRTCQNILVSATDNDEMQRLTQLVLHTPETLDLRALGGGARGPPAITHHAVPCADSDRLLVLMALLKLGIVRKRVLVFVNSVAEAFRVRLFLEAFGLKVALLNSELPLNSRVHILQSFNKGMFDYLIATDEGVAQQPTTTTKTAKGKQPAKGKGTKRNADSAFGVTRGVDFKGVRTVINYQPPPSVASYTHRVGRTGRAGHAGIAVTLLSPIDDAVRTQLDAHLVSTGAAGVTANSSAHPGLQPLPRLTAASIESLRYRAEDVARSITKLAIKEARARDLRQQLLNSQRLTEHFASNPGEMQLLQHAAPLRGSQAPGHLKHIPGYLRDSAAPGHPGGGARHRGTMSRKKRQKLAAGRDPVKGFVRAPKRGSGADDAPTEMEVRAAEVAKKDAKKAAKKDGKVLVHKRNVRRNVGRKR